MNNERDWKTNPLPGDVVRGRYRSNRFETRTVTERSKGYLIYHRNRKPTKYGSFISIENWAKWAETAEVVYAV